MNSIEPRPIGQLILNKETPQRDVRVEHYLIPAYQRGYRWTELHVKALLEDIDSFMQQQSQNGAVKESYCLQPIVVVPAHDEEGKRIWEIVDGQQRLITLYIVLKRLGKRKFEFYFERRPKSNDFLHNLSIDHYDHSTPDFHFMSEAYRVVDKWFNEKEENNIAYVDAFATILQTQVQVIWYEIDLKTNDPKSQEEEKIDVFNRLNIGRIPLEDAELIRALLMSKVEGRTEREKMLRQSEFSNEWYEIEHWLQLPEIWNFFTQKKLANHIQLIFELMAHKSNSENYNTYKWFESELKKSGDPIEKSIELWNRVKLIFGYFRRWINNVKLFHYIGFLLASGQIKLLELVEQSSLEKDMFLKKIELKVKEYLDGVDIDTLSYENDPSSIKNILLLFNVLTTQQLTADNQRRFPFNLYNNINAKEKWSLEHIHAQKSQDPLKNESIIKDWISDTLNSIENVDYIIKDGEENKEPVDIRPLKKELCQMSKKDKIDQEKFNDLRIRIVDAFESKSTKHMLDNLALLSCPDNARLNNAIFPVKRDRIIQMEREGHFVPICTRNVFLKMYSKADTQPYFWSLADKKNYIEEFHRVFDNFKKSIKL